MNVIIDTLSPSYRKMRSEQDAENEALRKRLAEVNAECDKLTVEFANKCIECGEAQGQAADLRTKLDAANTELHDLRIRAGLVGGWQRDVLLYLEEDENTEAIRLKTFAPQVQP